VTNYRIEDSNSYGYVLILIYFYTKSLFSSFSYPLIRCIDFMCCVLSCFSRVQLFATLWTRACQAPLSMGFSRQEYWSGLPCPPPGDLPNPGIEPKSLMSPALTGRFFTTSTTWEAHWLYMFQCLSNHPTFSFSHWVQKSVLYVCVSFVALYVGSLVPFFQVSYDLYPCHRRELLQVRITFPQLPTLWKAGVR